MKFFIKTVEIVLLSLTIVCLLATIYFTPEWVANTLSPDGILAQKTITLIYSVRILLIIVGSFALFIGVMHIIKPDIFQSLYTRCYNSWKKYLKIFVFIFPILFIICTILLKSYNSGWYNRLMVKEDSFFEWLTFFFYFLAFFISVSISITYYKIKYFLPFYLYMFLSIALLFVAMEEISWGQRIFGVSTPDILLSYNIQEETNIHNIKGFPLHTLYIIVGFYGAFIRFIIPVKYKEKYSTILKLYVPDHFLFFYFFFVGGLYFYYEYVWSGWEPGHFINAKDQEPVEFLLSAGFLLFTGINKYRQKIMTKNRQSLMDEKKVVEPLQRSMINC